MSISSSLSNAMSGLTASARAAEIVSSNVANSLTEGYGRRDLELVSASLAGRGAGVRMVGVNRNVDHLTIGERRLADADLGQASAQTDFLQRLEEILGRPDSENSLTSRIAGFESALIEAASRPDSETRLAATFMAANGLTDHFNGASDKIQDLRLSADQEIARQVSQLNEGLENIATLNQRIRSLIGTGQDASALMDQRQRQIDQIGTIVPLREVDRDHGQIALFTPGGAILLDGKAANISFGPVGEIVPEMTLGSGALSGLSLNGTPLATGSDSSLAGGSLAGLFAVRDELAPTAQTRLDAVARDLIERFADAAVDPTLGATDAGLFTDSGTAFSAINETGLAGRLSINALVDPNLGGDLSKLRDGLGATIPGDSGDATLLLALADALTNTRVPASGGFIGAARSAVGLSGDFLSLVNLERNSAETHQSFALAQAETLKIIELQSGVDTDHELQQLLLIEQAYAANARVISSIDEMIQTLLGL